MLRLDTSNPPGNEHLVVEYLKQVLDKEGIPVADLRRSTRTGPNVVARLKGNGRKRPLLIMGHSDVVNVDAAKWKFPPFSATRDGGYVYGRGTVDDKDNLTAGADDDAAAEAAERAARSRRDLPVGVGRGRQLGRRHRVSWCSEHFPEIDAEYCLAEGGGVTRIGGEVKYATVQTLEKIPRGIELVAHGISGHGSVPLKSNAIVHLAGAVAKVGDWRPDIRFNETTGTYFRRLAAISPPEVAKYYRDVLSTDPKVRAAADDWLFENEPRHSSMLRTSVSPNIFTGGYRSNVIPSEAKATLDVRVLPDEDPAKFLEQVKQVVNDPAVDVHFTGAERAAGRRRTRGSTRKPFKALEAAGTQHLQRADAADDEHRRDRHGAAAREGRAVLRHRSGDRFRGRAEGLRRAQRSGAAARERAAPLRALQLGRRHEPGAGKVTPSRNAKTGEDRAGRSVLCELCALCVLVRHDAHEDAPRRLITAARPKRARVSTVVRMSRGSASKSDAIAYGKPPGRIQRTTAFCGSNVSLASDRAVVRGFPNTTRCSQ